MSLQKLGKQLKKECLRSPKKAAILATGLLVAGWFWAPLLQEWFGSKPSAGASNKAAKEVAIAQSEGIPAASAPAKLDWQALLAQLESDPRRQSSDENLNNKKPFAALPTSIEIEDEPEPTPEPEEIVETLPPAGPNAITPEMLGMTLTGTMVGPQLRLATINGENYQEKSRLAVRPNQYDTAADDLAQPSPIADLSGLAGLAGLDIPAATQPSTSQSPAIPTGVRYEFLLAKIYRQYVVLERDGKSYRLDLKQTPSNSGRIVLRSARP